MFDCDVSLVLSKQSELHHLLADQPHMLLLYDAQTAIVQTFSAHFTGLRRMDVSNRPGIAVNVCTSQF